MKAKTPVRRIELNLRDLSQLFNSMDPSPFHEKDLDHDAEEFILGWAQEYHLHEPVALTVHLQQLPGEGDPKKIVEQAVHNYFTYRARMNKLEFSRLMKQARTSFIIGLGFLSSCLLGVEMLAVSQDAGTWTTLLKEGLTIIGWVSMWRPVEIYLYEWWPLKRLGHIYEKLGRMHVEVHLRQEPRRLDPAAEI
ncbi:MAG: hypothetical protein HZA89_06655 [Verrucomicrobia bacterium]|nr:hypothetical protein [Verrucomicrobiota bacterium]